ncbi:hypothetical protein ACERII_11645 [Evansella sp. AB-rgal1]|uniref:hypothetical protein n=1 Tax=Evansella sp. AB-rgal1 TaxID=3242696 RepID=UPI00359D228F
MLRSPSFLVKRKARRYKRWLEKISVYPYPYVIAGLHYYLVDYVKLHKPIGSAIISTDGEEVEKDAKRAHQKLYQFYRLSEKIQEEGKLRAQVNLDLFRAPLAKMDEQPSPKWEEAYAFIKNFLGYQLTYRKTYEDFWQHIQKRSEDNLPITDEELKLAIYTAAKLQTTQEFILKGLADNAGVLKEWKKNMQEADLWKELKRDQQVFFTELMQNEEFMKNEAKKIKSDNYEQALKMYKQDMESYMKKEQKLDEEILRYP